MQHNTTNFETETVIKQMIFAASREFILCCAVLGKGVYISIHRFFSLIGGVKLKTKSIHKSYI